MGWDRIGWDGVYVCVCVCVCVCMCDREMMGCCMFCLVFGLHFAFDVVHLFVTLVISFCDACSRPGSQFVQDRPRGPLIT